MHEGTKMRQDSSSNVIRFPGPPPGMEPYMAWSSAREAGGVPYDPPLNLFLASPGQVNGWTSHVADGEDPKLLRIQVYLRKGWNGEAGTLCVGNIGPSGNSLGGPLNWLNEDPAARPGAIRDLTVSALCEVESLAAIHGFERVAFADPSHALRDILRGRGYFEQGQDMVQDPGRA